MVLKYTDVTDLGVRIFGMVHGVVFIGYCLTTVLVAVDQRWSRGRLLLGLAASIPPFFTVLFDRYAEKHGVLGTSWRLTHRDPEPASSSSSVVLAAAQPGPRRCSPAWSPSPR